MKKIFKYDYDKETGEVKIPLGAEILRIDHVDDGFYKGDFLWAIVDTQEECVRQYISPSMGFPFCAGRGDLIPKCEAIKIKIKEDQIVKCGTPVYAQEKDGDIFIYSLPDGVSEKRILVFKTGQEIPVDTDRLTYLGLNRLWIIQELGLYTFLYV